MWLIFEQFPIKPGLRDAPFVIRGFNRDNKQSWISHHGNLDLSSWKSRLRVKKSRSLAIKSRSCVHHENKSRLTDPLYLPVTGQCFSTGITTNKGMSISFGYTTQEKTYKALQNLDKKKHVKKMTSLWKNKITQGYIFLLYRS